MKYWLQEKKKQFNMKDFFKDISGERVLQVALVAGIVLLAYNNMDGWGWLVFALICTL